MSTPHQATLEARPILIGGLDVPVVSELPWDAEGDDSLVREPEHELRALMSVAPRKLTPTEKKKARSLIQRYCARSIITAATKHYSQARPMTHLEKSPDLEWTADCSGHATGAFCWADKWLPATVEDPNGMLYSGFGNTGTLLTRNIAHRVPTDRTFFVGDMGLYGPVSATRHVVTCFKGGKAGDALWASHGSEAGPYAVRLMYRTDFLCVVRARSLL